MLRRGRWKFVRCPGDPDQLYDLAEDGAELRNLASSPDAAGFGEEADRRWDFPALRARVVESQRRRRLVADALRIGALRGWDYQPVRDASRQYMRSHMNLDELEAAARFPRV